MRCALDEKLPYYLIFMASFVISDQQLLSYTHTHTYVCIYVCVRAVYKYKYLIVILIYILYCLTVNCVGYSLFGKIPMDLLHSSWEKTLSLGGRADMTSTVIMHSCYMKVCFLWCISRDLIKLVKSGESKIILTFYL